MSDEMTTRLALPLLQIGQAQKEATHNEALTLLDLAVQTAVVAIGVNVPPTAPVPGQCWIVGAAPTGVWTGKVSQFAGWTSGGWRFIAPSTGMAVWSIADGTAARFVGAMWTLDAVRGMRLVLGGNPVVGSRQPAITGASGGTVIDTEARAAIAAMLTALRTHGLIAP